MATQNKRSVLVCAGLAVSSALVAAAAQAQPQDVSFIGRRDFDAGRNPYSVAVSDFNGDGLQDLAVANNRSRNVSVLLGNGDGSFGPAQNLAVGNGPESVAVGDFNGDGVKDLAVANNLDPTGRMAASRPHVEYLRANSACTRGADHLGRIVDANKTTAS